MHIVLCPYRACETGNELCERAGSSHHFSSLPFDVELNTINFKISKVRSHLSSYKTHTCFGTDHNHFKIIRMKHDMVDSNIKDNDK